MGEYIHGYSERELIRLREQSFILEELLHSDTAYPAGAKVLEAGCGVGGQTVILARRSPEAEFTCADMSTESIEKARGYVEAEGLGANVTFVNANLNENPFEPETFDHVFVCFVLEHLPDPLSTLRYLKSVLKPGGTITVIEGDHEACVWTPETDASLAAWRGLIKSQQDLGHDPLIGRRVYPLLHDAGFEVKSVNERVVYADGANLKLLDGMVNKIIVPMTKTAKEASVKAGYCDAETFDQGIKDLEATGDPPYGTFFYSWFKGFGVKQS